MLYIEDHKLQDWANVYNSKDTEYALLSAGKKSFTNAYDVWFFPTFFVLDKDKNFIGKKMTYKPMVELVESLLKKK